MRACIHCGCTETNACEVLVSFAQADGAGELAVVGCWWISLEPPVCSAVNCYLRFISRPGA